MKLKNSFFYTIREDVKNEESTSGNLLVRGGMIKKESAGTYMFMPLGLKVLRNIEAIIRDEMEKTGALEVLMPSLIHADVYEKSGRNKAFGNSVFRLQDRFKKPYVLGPTHEELFTIAAKQKVKSYKDLPFNIFQFQNKFRDEPRPRYGLIRVREFIMKDAYSFDLDLDGLEKSYQKMFQAYKNIFDRLGFNYKIVTSDTGIMGGLLSEEFQAITDIGEDKLAFCKTCDFASNIDIAKVIPKAADQLEMAKLELVHTPSCKTVKDVSDLLKVESDCLAKTMIYKVDEELVACIISGDREANETKILKLLGGSTIELPEKEEINKKVNTSVGFSGPIGLKLKIILDQGLLDKKNLVTGANKDDYHYINANVERDFKYDLIGDITNIKEGDTCPKCGKVISFTKGIEVGNTFKLGTKYAEALGLEYLDQENKLKPVVMGSYGIGLGRTLASFVEQNNDENGMIWPLSIAPYKVAIVQINMKDEDQTKLSADIYDKLIKENIEVVYDNRDERPGVKFKDMDLIGIPIRITVGKKASENIVEFKKRINKELTELNVADVLAEVRLAIKTGD